MLDINWNAVSQATVAAVIVTLVVEYLAKPRLEARKERILETLRARRALSTLVLELTLSATFLTLEVPKDVEMEARERIRTERQRHYTRMGELALELFDRSGKYAGAYMGMGRDLVFGYVTTVRGVLLSARTQHRQAEIIVGLGQQLATALEGRWWRPLHRGRAVVELRRLIAETQEPAEDQGRRP